MHPPLSAARAAHATHSLAAAAHAVCAPPPLPVLPPSAPAQVLILAPVAGARWSASAARATGAASEADLLALGFWRRDETKAALRGTEGGDEQVEALEAQDEEAAVLCGWLPEFADELVRKLIDALDYFDKSSDGRVPYRSAIYLLQWRRTAVTLFQQMSEDLYEAALPQLLTLLHRPALLDAVKHVGALLAAASWASPSLFLSRALPPCFKALLSTPKIPKGGADGAAAGACALEPLSESELRWWLLLLSYSLRCSGEALLPYLPSLKQVLELTRNHTEHKVVTASAKLRKVILHALLGTYLTETRSLPPAAWESARVRATPWQTYGWRPPLLPREARLSGISASWHIPSAAELEAAGSLMEETLARAERLTETVCAAEELVPTDEVRACLLELRAIAKTGMATLADEPNGASLTSAPDVVSDAPLGSSPGGPSVFEQPVGSQYASYFDADAHGTPPAAPADGGGMVVEEEADAADTEPPQMALRSVVAACGRATVPPTACPTPISRLAALLVRLGMALAPREAARNLTLLLQVATLIFAERISSHKMAELQQMMHLSQRSCSLRGGGRPKWQPRGNLLCKVELRHMMRVNASSFAAAVRTPALYALARMQLRLSTHAYSSVRSEAQSGFAYALRNHPWLARASLPTMIRYIASPTAERSQTKGALFLLSTRAALKRAASDYTLLCALIVALVDARDHALPKLQQRARNLFTALCDAVPAPLPQHVMATLQSAAVSAVAIPEEVRVAVSRHYERNAARDERARRSAIEALLRKLPSPTASAMAETPSDAADGSSAMEVTASADGSALPPASATAQNHWSQEVAAMCGLIVLPIDDNESRAAFALRAAHGLCSPISAVRKLSRASLSMALTKPRAPGPPVLRSASPPADLFAPLPATDEEWAACKFEEKLMAGWASAQYYASPSPATQPAGAKRVRPLGDATDDLFTDTKFVSGMLQWLVTDHKEADSVDGGGRDLFRSAHDVVMSMLAPSRRWPSTPGHGVEFKDFELRQAQLFKGLAAHYGPALVPALLPPLLDLMKSSARDAQAVATEALAGLVRGAGHWPLSEQRRLWEAVCPALRAALRACSVQSLGDWQACLRYMAFNRDPRRIAWLATMLMEEAEQRAAEALALETTDVAMPDAAASEPGKASGDGGETAVMVTTSGGESGGTSQTSLLQANCLRFLAPLVVELGWRG